MKVAVADPGVAASSPHRRRSVATSPAEFKQFVSAEIRKQAGVRTRASSPSSDDPPASPTDVQADAPGAATTSVEGLAPTGVAAQRVVPMIAVDRSPGTDESVFVVSTAA